MLTKPTRDQMIALMYRHQSHYLVFDGGQDRYGSGMMNCVGMFDNLEDAAKCLSTSDWQLLGRSLSGEKIPDQHILHIDNSIDGTQSLNVLYYDEHGELNTELLTDLKERKV